jgi:hypothetical protein
MVIDMGCAEPPVTAAHPDPDNNVKHARKSHCRKFFILVFIIPPEKASCLQIATHLSAPRRAVAFAVPGSQSA